MKCRLAIVCLLAMALPGALLLAIWPDEAPEAVRAPDALPRDVQAPVEPVLPPALAPVQLPTLEEISARTAPAPPGDPPAPTAPDVAPAAVVPSDLPAASEETRPFHFSGRVTYADGSPVAVGTVTLSFWFEYYRPHPTAQKRPGHYEVVPACDDWSAALIDGAFEGAVALRVAGHPRVKLRLAGPDFADVEAGATLRGQSDVTFAGDLRSRPRSFEGSAECTLGVIDHALPPPVPVPVLVPPPPLASDVSTGGPPNVAAPPPAPRAAVIVAREARLTVLFPRTLTDAASPAIADSDPDKIEDGACGESDAGRFFLVDEWDLDRYDPLSRSLPASVTDRGSHWELAFGPVTPARYFLWWRDRRGTTGAWTRKRWYRELTAPVYGPFTLADGVAQVLDLLPRGTGTLTGMLLDARGRPWTGPAIVTWTPGGPDPWRAPAPRFREAGEQRVHAFDGRFSIPDLLPGEYRFAVTPGNLSPSFRESPDTAMAQVGIEDGRRTDLYLEFAATPVTARAVCADGSSPGRWRLERFEVQREGDEHPVLCDAWILHWPSATFRTGYDDRGAEVAQAEVPFSFGVERDPSSSSWCLFTAPRWWQEHPNFSPGCWLAGQSDQGWSQPEDEDEVVFFAAFPARTAHGFLLRATAGARSAVQYFPVGVPDESLVFRLGP